MERFIASLGGEQDSYRSSTRLTGCRKLALAYPNGDTPSVLLFSERLGGDVPIDAVSTISADYQAHLGTFLASLVFWQDLLEHCASNEVKQTLLDHFQYLFLQQLL